MISESSENLIFTFVLRKPFFIEISLTLFRSIGNIFPVNQKTDAIAVEREVLDHAEA